MFTVASDYQIMPYLLVGLTDQDLGNQFVDYVNAEEKNGLKKLLGMLLYEALVVGMTALPADWDGTETYALNDLVCYGDKIYKSLNSNTNKQPDTNPSNWVVQADNRWLKLREGEDYTYNNRKYNWVGMVTMLIPYIYSRWTEDTADSQTQQGIVAATSENSERVSPAVRICKAFNAYHDYAVGLDVRQLVRSMCDSLYGYLYANSTTFDDLVSGYSDYSSFADYLCKEFCSPGRMNVWGI